MFLDDSRAAFVEIKTSNIAYHSLIIFFITFAGQLLGFFREATFYNSVKVDQLLVETGFQDFRWVQTLCRLPEEIM